MVDFKQEMDAHSLTLERDGRRIGFLQWHPDREPGVVLYGSAMRLSVEEMRQVLARYDRDRANREQARAMLRETAEQLKAGGEK